MPEIKIPKNRIDYLAGELEARMSPDILTRGWEYFHKRRVSKLQLVNGTELEAQVKGGSDRYEVTLDLEKFQRSSCSCPYASWCKHMAAVFFQAYSAHARPEFILRQMQQAMRTKSRRTGASADKTLAARKTDVSAADLPMEWQQFFDKRFHGFTLSYQHSIESFYQTAWSSLTDYAAQWDPAIQGLYRVHVLLFILRKMERFAEENQSAYMSYYYDTGIRTASAQCLENLSEAMKALDQEAVARLYPKHWRQTMEFVGENSLDVRKTPVDWLGIYRLFWWELFDDPQARKEERLRLALLLDKDGLSKRQEDMYRIAFTHFQVMGGDDEGAMKELEGLHGKLAGDFFLLLQGLYRHEAWDRLLAWLRWLLPVTASAKQDDFNRICQFWSEAVRHRDDDGEWLAAMRALLPRSYYYYTDYLMKTERYAQWIDLQLANRVPPYNLYTNDIKTVQDHDPALLLPLFHQAVERCILEKNRTSYKMAVRQLRKLHACYKKLKQLPRWEDYIHRLAAKYSRLRAFQEELQKGKWLT